MGKVLSYILNGYPGAIARSLDDVVVALANKSGAALDFGVAVAMDTAHTGVVKFDPTTHTGADFVGITVRNPSKTPDTYGSNVGSYGKDDMVDVLVRGHIVARLDSYDGKLGDQVGISTTDGSFVTETGSGVVTLPNVRVSNVRDAAGCAEFLLTERNVL